MFSACREQERRDGLPIATLAVYCADGANVNSGCKHGVAIQYQELQPTCVFTHCCGHKGALVGKDATDAVPTVLRSAGGVHVEILEAVVH